MGLADVIEENKRQWAEINKLTAELKALRGTLEAQNTIYGDLIKAINKSLTKQFWVIIFLIGALIYGAIGKDGLFAVRQTIPLPCDDTTALASPIAPPPDNRIHPATPPIVKG